MRLLLAAGALVNLQDQRYQRTPIFLASEVGNVDMVSELIQRGSKLNVTDKYGMEHGVNITWRAWEWRAWELGTLEYM